MQVWNVLHAARCKCRIQKSRQKSPSGHHHTTLSGYIFATKARIDNRKKNLLSSDMSSTCPHNMVNLGPLAAEIVSLVWGTPCNFHRVLRLGSVTARHSSSGRQRNFAALNRRRHLCSAGRPSRWALAHILVLMYILLLCLVCTWSWRCSWSFKHIIACNYFHRLTSLWLGSLWAELMYPWHKVCSSVAGQHRMSLVRTCCILWMWCVTYIHNV